MKRFLRLALIFVFSCIGLTPQLPAEQRPIQAISMLGVPLTWAAVDSQAQARCDQAFTAYQTDTSEANTIWYARRLGYVGEMQKALFVLDDGLKRFPKSYQLLRHRGHRLLAMRQFSLAIDDFEKAGRLIAGKPLEIEPDGIPNKLNRPLANTQFNIFYHLGLACYLCADYAKAAAAYAQCEKWAVNSDLKVALADWRVITYQRLGQSAMVKKILRRIPVKLSLIEDAAYHQRLLMYKGLRQPEELLSGNVENELDLITQGYGVGNWYAQQGETEKAREIFLKIMKLKAWNAFGYIAAEADLARMLPFTPQATVEGALTAWQAFWNSTDLNALANLFVAGERVSYYSSEKKGLIFGLAALQEHHRGFGFVPGGNAAANRLWLDDVCIEAGSSGCNRCLVTATWFFAKDCRNLSAAQSGPVTFVFEKNDANWQILHAHFANWPGK